MAEKDGGYIPIGLSRHNNLLLELNSRLAHRFSRKLIIKNNEFHGLCIQLMSYLFLYGFPVLPGQNIGGKSSAPQWTAWADASY